MATEYNSAHAPLSEARKRGIIVMLMCFMPLMGMGIDLIAPSLPAINHALHTSPMVAKDLITFCIIGSAISTFFSGILSETWGRRPLILSGFILLVIVSILPALWPYPSILLLSRLLQGIAIGTFGVLMRSVAVDLLTGPALLRTAAWLATMWAIGPIIGPVIGSYLQVYIGWQANFLFFAVYGFISLIACLLWLPETHHKRTALSFKRVKNNFSLLLRHKVFMSISVLMGCLFSFLVVFNSLGPFFIEKKLGYTPIFFGHAAFCLGLIALCGTFFCRALIKRFTSQEILSIALPMVLLCALLGVLITHYYSNNVWAILIPTAVLYFSNGILYPTCMGATMSLFREMAGSAAAIASLINLCIATLSGFLMSLIDVQSATSITTACATFIFIGFSFYTWAIRAEEPVQAVAE